MNTRKFNFPFLEARFDLATLFVAATIGSLLSIVATGYLVGVRNDIYFLPIIEALYDKPQFANDAFIQSLRYYSSGLWILLSGVSQHVNTYWLLFCLNLLSRFISFAGFLACASLLGVTRRKEVVLLTALLCATSLLRGQSLAGDGGLFINYFTHSEIANGLTLLILYCAVRGRIVTALFLNGLVFFLNLFIGAWDAFMLASVAFFLLFSGELSWRELVLRGTVGTLLAGALGAPALRNVLINPDFGVSLGFDYLTYLEEFWPYHFIFLDIELREKLSLVSIFAARNRSFRSGWKNVTAIYRSYACLCHRLHFWDYRALPHT